MDSKNIFHTERDHYKWSKQKEYTCSQENIDEATRKKAVLALEFLEQEFGKHFLKTHSINHPVRQKISNTASWQIEELIEFTDTLQQLKLSDSNYAKLLKKLMGMKSAVEEGIPFVEVAKMCHKQGLDIFFIAEEKIGSVKTPDIKVINKENGETFYIEISTLNDSDDRKNINKNYNFFYKEFNYGKPVLPFFGCQKTTIGVAKEEEEKEYAEISKIITDARRRVIENGQIIYYSDKRFCFLFAPDDSENFNEICIQNGINAFNIESLAVDFDDTSRINNKIGKSKQIPSGINGLLYVYVSPLFFQTADLVASIERIEANMAKYTNLLGIVLCSKIVDQREQVAHQMGHHLFARRTIRNLSCESLLIYNGSCDVRLSEDTIAKIYKSLA